MCSYMSKPVFARPSVGDLYRYEDQDGNANPIYSNKRRLSRGIFMYTTCILKLPALICQSVLRRRSCRAPLFSTDSRVIFRLPSSNCSTQIRLCVFNLADIESVQWLPVAVWREHMSDCGKPRKACRISSKMSLGNCRLWIRPLLSTSAISSHISQRIPQSILSSKEVRHGANGYRMHRRQRLGQWHQAL